MTKEVSKQPIQKVDVKEIFYEKNPKIARLIPGFIYKIIKKIIHEDYVNYLMERYGHKSGLEYNEAIITDFKVTFKINGKENIPESGRFIFVANHPLGGFDGMILMHIIKDRFPEFKFLVNDILMNMRNLEPVFLPINKHGQQGRDNARIIQEQLSSDIQILSFPAGMVSRVVKGKVCDLEWKKSFISQAITYQRDIIPIHISGKNSKLFYRIYRIRKFFGIKANLEMFLLPDETYKHQKKSFTITFGKTIPYQTFDKRFKKKDWATKIKEFVYTLPDDNTRSFTNLL